MKLVNLFADAMSTAIRGPIVPRGNQNVKHVGWVAGRTDGTLKGGHRRELIVTTDIEKAQTHRIPGKLARTAPIRVYRKVWKDNGRKTKHPRPLAA